MSTFNLQGLVPSVVTAFTADDQIDRAGLRRVIRYLLDGGVRGQFVLGSTIACSRIRAGALDVAYRGYNANVHANDGRLAALEPTGEVDYHTTGACCEILATLRE